MKTKEATYTPGPWVMVPHHSNGIYGKTFSIGPKSTEPNGGEQLKRFVATASSSQHSVTSEETEANASLISAAKEMLAILKEIAWHIDEGADKVYFMALLENSEDSTSRKDDPIRNRFYGTIRGGILSAIAKATGQEEGR